MAKYDWLRPRPYLLEVRNWRCQNCTCMYVCVYVYTHKCVDCLLCFVLFVVCFVCVAVSCVLCVLSIKLKMPHYHHLCGLPTTLWVEPQEICVCHPCAGAMLIFSLSFNVNGWSPKRIQLELWYVHALWAHDMVALHSRKPTNRMTPIPTRKGLVKRPGQWSKEGPALVGCVWASVVSFDNCWFIVCIYLFILRGRVFSLPAKLLGGRRRLPASILFYTRLYYTILY